MKIVSLGAGKVGAAIALELAKTCSVTSVDLSSANLNRLKALNPKINTITQNASDITAEFLKPYDLVISGVPGFLGYKTLRNVINAGKDVIDISFLPENHLDLNELAKAKGVTAIVDAGLAPGLSNLLCGHIASTKQVDKITIFVGGVPQVRTWPFQYKAPFSFVDVIEEYTRPARIKLFNHIVEKKPMSSAEIVETEIGSLEAFYTDGVRSLLYTIPEVPTIIEKTMRYPGYAEYMNILKYTGFFSTTPVEINGAQVTPLQFTSKLLNTEFYLSPEDQDLAVLQVIGEGKENIRFEMVDRYCTDTKLSAMARTTGYTACACAELIIQKKWKDHGVYLMEHIGRKQDSFQFILNYLAQKNIKFKTI